MPSKAAGDEEEVQSASVDVPGAEDAPGWLRELGASLSAEGESRQPVLPENDEVPDWLQDLRASLPEESVPGGNDVGASDTGEAEEVPDWLAEMRPAAEEPASAPEPVAPVVEEGEAPDWLAELRPTAEEPAPTPEPAAPVAEEEEVPDWLAELRPAAEEPASAPEPAAPVAEEGEAPDWLAELRPTTEEAASASEPAAPVAEEGEAPDWLAELRPTTEEPAPTPEPAAPVAEEGEAPDWLAELRPTTEEPAPTPEPAAPVAEEEEVPDWLAELRPTAEEPAPTPEPAAPVAEEEEVPDWLAEMRPAAEEPAFAPEPAAPVAEEEEVPDWLAKVQPAVEELEPEPLAPQAEVGEVVEPDWLAELEASAEEPEDVAPSAGEGIAAATVPSWLAQMQPEGLGEPSLPVGEPLAEAELPDWLVPTEPGMDEDESLERAEIPEWLLALKPHELRDVGEEMVEAPLLAAEEAIEDTGLLAGIPGTLPMEMLIVQPRGAVLTETEPLVADTPEARLFAEIVSRPPQAAPQTIEQPKPSLLTSLPRWIIYLALIVAVTLPLLLGEPLLPRTVEPAPMVENLYGEIASLSSGAPVLVAFDYDPATSGEMGPLAQALVSHLMDQEARVIAVSLLPAGPATAQSLLEEMVVDRPGYADGYGQSYANLGYLPGQASAVQLMKQSLATALPRDFYGTPLADLEIVQGLSALQDFDLVVELAAGQDTLRWWIEQGGVPQEFVLGAGVSALLEPITRAYYETEPQQLVGMVSGVPGAVTYETIKSGRESPEGPTAARLDSQLAGHLILILVVLVGNVVYFARRGMGKER